MNIESKLRECPGHFVQKPHRIRRIDVDDGKVLRVLEGDVDPDIRMEQRFGAAFPAAMMPLKKVFKSDVPLHHVVKILFDFFSLVIEKLSFRCNVDHAKLIDDNTVIAGKNLSVENIRVVCRENTAQTGKKKWRIMRYRSDGAVRFLMVDD